MPPPPRHCEEKASFFFFLGVCFHTFYSEIILGLPKICSFPACPHLVLC